MLESVSKMLKITLASCLVGVGSLCCYAKSAEQEKSEKDKAALQLLLLILQQRQREEYQRQQKSKELNDVIRSMQPCFYCNGSGWRDAGRGTRQQCLSCGGTGFKK